MSRKRKKQTINNLIVVSDMHCGCQGGLCPIGGVPIDEGGFYKPSKLQEKVWHWWEEFWGLGNGKDGWVHEVSHHEPFAVAINGDALDGRHHNSTHQITQNLSDQINIAGEVLRPIVDLCEGRFYLIRGTEAHTGPSNENEEELARRLNARPDAVGRHARPELRIKIGGNGRAHLMHHIGTTGTSAYESTAVLKELIESYVEAGCWGREPYDAVVRSHRHRFMMITRPSRKGYAFSVVTPGWQLKTPFAYKIPGGRMASPQFGGTLLRQGDQDFYTRHFVRSIEPPKEEIL